MVRVVVVEGYGVKLRVRRRNLVVEAKSGRKVLPLAEIDRVVIVSSGVSITSSAVRLLARNGIDVLFLDSRGYPITTLVPPWITATVDTRRAQYLAYVDPARGLEMAKSFAIAKILNQANYIKKLAMEVGERSLLEDAEKIAEKVHQVRAVVGRLDECRQSIMGIEGNAARIYWGAIAQVLPKDIAFPGRDQDSSDPFNLCLNYLYGILYAESFRVLTKYGLDPFAGFLHVDRSGKPVLTFDYVEMFRVSAVDSLLVNLFRSGYRPRVEESGLLSRDSRGKLVEEFYRWFERRARDSVGEVRKLCDHFKSYALKLARALRTSSSYCGFVEVWWR